MNNAPVLINPLKNSLIIRLNRPKVLNSLSIEMVNYLNIKLKEIQTKDSFRNIKSIIITGTGNAFSAGGDLKMINKYISKNQPVTYLKEIVPRVNELIQNIVNFPRPTLCALNGVAVGGGLNLAMACDIRIAINNISNFRLGFTDIGLTPATGGSYFPIRFLGLSRALHFSLTNQKFSSKQAYEWGLISDLSPANSFNSLIEQWCDKMEEIPFEIVIAVRKLMHSSWNNSLEDHLIQEYTAITEAGSYEFFKQKISKRLREIRDKPSLK